MDRDLEHLNLLSIFHYVVGGLTALFGCFPIFHLGFGIAILSGAFPDRNGEAPPPEMGWMFVIVGGGLILSAWSIAVLTVLAGRRLAQHRWYMFCMVVAGIECLFMPWGTVLGVFTIIVLSRPSVKELFDRNAPGSRDSDGVP
ncbi:MAG: hypothetical protein WD069_20705 [Planctomycetales bacterium]